MTVITCKLPEKLAAELEVAARAAGISKSQIVRKAIENQMDRQRGKRLLRAYDLVKNLSGSVKGPHDLLTNPKHMDDFGA